MANKKFILQGFTSKSHRDAIADLFKIDGIQRVIVSVAFVNSGGVKLLEAEFKKHSAKTTAFIGIRNDITSLQAAKRLLDLGITLYVVDTGSRRVLYHPKIYLVRGKGKTKLIIGSANLTPGGLNNNIEASILADCDMTAAADRLLVESIEKGFDGQPAEYPKNVLKITTAAQLDKLHEKGLLVDEATAAPPKPATSGSSPADDSVPRIKLKVPPITVPLSAAKKAPAKTAPAKKTPTKKGVAKKTAVATMPAATGVTFERVWESKELTRRDLDIPIPGKNSNRTYSMNFDKGQLDDSVVFQHYFRNQVFNALNWSLAKSKKREEAYAVFGLFIKGKSKGEFKLRISHSPSPMYIERKNSPTSLHWGEMRDIVAQPNLIGRTLSLSRDKADPTRFMLEID